MLATIIQMNSSSRRAPRKIKPTIINIRGIQITVYNNIDSWKLSDSFPFISTNCDSYFLDDQQISGPIIPPKGIINCASALR